MPDIVDAFVVSLGIDATEYEKEIKKFRADRKDLAEENDKYNRDERDGQKKTVEGIRKIRNETAGFLLMLAGASSVAGFAKDLLTADANTGRFARNIGMATERVSVWENAIKQVGGTSQEAQQGLKTLYDIFQNREYGLDNSKDFILARFGLTAKDLKNPEEALLRISDRLKSMPRANAQKELELLGLSDSFVGLLSGDRGDLRKMLDSIEKAGVATDESAEAAMTLEQEMVKTAATLQDALRPGLDVAIEVFKALSEIIRNDVIPVFKSMVGWLAPIFGKGTPDINTDGSAPDGYRKVTTSHLGGLFKTHSLEKISQRPAAAGGGGWFGMSPLGMLADMQNAGAPVQPARLGKLTRAERNNNPGNIEDGRFARSQPGYAGSDGRFAKFATADAGFAAMESLIQGKGYMGGGRNTIAKIIAKYAPASENNVGAYAGAVERATGINRNAVLSASQIRAVTRAMARHEGYRGGSVDIAATGRNLRTPAAANRATRNVSTSRTTTIGAVNVYTQATQADQITRDMAAALMKRDLVVQGGTGLKP